MIRYVENLAGREALAHQPRELPEPRCRTCGRRQLPGEWEGWGNRDRRPAIEGGPPADLKICTCGSCLTCHQQADERMKPTCPPMTRR